VTPDQSDSSLLQEYSTHRSQDAFTELVSRHSDWVYSAALRMVRDRHLAEDVAQAVFLVLADKAGKLSAIPLHRWLFKVTRYASANALRARSRRDKHERFAAMLTSETQESDPDRMWQDIAPVLDDSISRLRAADRDALILRFYQQKSVAEVGAALGVSEGAAKVRIVRALEKLRDRLRNRGIATAADALGIAMIAHTTHAAPATFIAGCTPAAASIKATALSKGISIMTLSTKIKIAAGLLLLGGVSVGAGAYYMTSAPAQPNVPPVQTAPAAVVAPEIDYGFDPRIAPFVTDHTDMIVAVDLTKINLDALAADMRTELARSKMDAPSTARINGILQMGLMAGHQWINGFKQAGGSNIFMLSRADELSLTSMAGAPSLKLSGTFLYPTDSPAAARLLARYLTRPGSKPPQVVGNTVVDESLSPRPLHTAEEPDPRPALAAGMAAAGDMPLSVTINPPKFKDIIRKLMAAGSMSVSINDDEWVGLDYTSMQVVLPPAESPAFVCISHYDTPALAEKARSKAVYRMAHEVGPKLGKGSALAAQMGKFIASEKFTVKDSNVVATLDLHPYWDLLFAAANIAAQPPSTRPHGPRN
jgi:RNA polymerase sigma factor (sigma-70 family)